MTLLSNEVSCMKW